MDELEPQKTALEWHQETERLAAERDEWKRRAEGAERRLSDLSSGFTMRESIMKERDALAVQNEALRKALTMIDAMRKRLPDPDCYEQQTTVTGIVELIRPALALDTPRAAQIAEARRGVCEAVKKWKTCNPDDDEAWHGSLAELANAYDYLEAELRKSEDAKS